MWIIVFTLAVFVALLGLLRFTRLGLEMRAVTQNRQMAASMGIRTARIDALTFGLGSGIAGIAGVALSQIDNVSPNLGQGYIIDSFLVVVFGGVGNLWGTLVARLHARHRQQVPRALRRRGARQDRDPGAHHPVHPEAPARAVRPQGPGGGGMTASPLIRALDRGAVCVRPRARRRSASLVPLLNLLLPPSSPWHVPTYLVALWGKYVCYALLALSIDLIWGYCGILSLGHGAFFALGGYAMGMYLMRQIGTRGVYADPIRPDFMVFLNWPELPVYWYGFNYFAYAALMVLLVPGLLAFVFGWFAFRSRVTGVYLSIITQALTFALTLALLPQQFRLRRQQRPDRLQGHPRLQRAGAVDARRAVRDLGRGADPRLPDLPHHRGVEARHGAGLDPRRRGAHALPRLPGRILQAVRVHALGLHGGRRRRALRAAGRHHQSERVRAGQFDRGGDLGRGRRARHADRRGARRGRGQLRQDHVHLRLCSRPTGCSCSAACSCWSRCCCRAASSAPGATCGQKHRERQDGDRRARTPPRTPKPRRSRRSERDGQTAPPPRCSISTPSRCRSTASAR